MLIVSDRYTNRIRTETGKLVYLPPGEVFEVEDSMAREKIAAGRAELATETGPEIELPSEKTSTDTEPEVGLVNENSSDGVATPPEPTGPDAGPPNPTPESSTPDEELERVAEAILNLDDEITDHYLSDGRPKVEPLAQAMGRAVTAAERDAAWAALQA